MVLPNGGRRVRGFRSSVASSAPSGITLQQIGALMDGTGDTVIVTDSNGIIQYVNPAFTAATGFAPDEATGRTPSMLGSGLHSADFFRDLWQTLLAGREFSAVMINRRKNGEFHHLEQAIRPLFGAMGQITHFVSVGRDVSGRVAALERLNDAATRDSLTGVANRLLFLDHLDQALRHARRSGARFVLGILDVDHFKSINDSKGHAAGDEVLRAVAERLRLCIREIDTVARLGGDEFGILLLGTADMSSATHALRRVVGAFAPAIVTSGGALPISVSLGGCLCLGIDEDQDTLLALADKAMYMAKQAGGNRFSLSCTAPATYDWPRPARD